MLTTSLTHSSLFFEILSRELKNFLVEVPYNSISQFYKAFNKQETDKRFGVSCVWQSYELGRRLTEKGICDVSYYVDGRHIALVCSTDEEEYLIDPYLLHTTPIEIYRRFDLDTDNPITRESYAYPYRKTGKSKYKPAKVVTKYYPSSNEISLTYKRFSPSKEHYVPSRLFRLKLDNEFSTTPPDVNDFRHLLHHGEQNNLSIRIVHRKDYRMYELIYPVALHHRQPISENNLIARDNNGRMLRNDNSEAYAHLVRKLSDSIQCSSEELISFVLGGVEIYEEHAPDLIKHANFYIKDE
ncbi:MAG: hypothetical protein MI867_29335 [Pseudomonadales bacterium]|nr:hypothetical protein [Pseudomonadales bacterium]